MAQYLCPHCRNPLAVPDSLAGSVVECDMCGGSVTIPAMAMVPYDQPPTQTMPQFIVVNTPAPRYQQRLKSAGWFSRAFSTTFGVLMAILAVNLILAIVGAFVVVMFLEIASADRPQAQPPKISRSR